MAVTYAVLTGRITHPGSDTALPGLVTAVPLTKFAGVVIPGERLVQGVVSAPVDAAGNLPAAGLKVPVVAGSPTLWRLVFEPSSTTARPDTNGGALPRWPFYVGAITASTTVMALAATEPTALLADFPPSVLAQVLTARDQTVAVGNTNDTIIASRVNDPASATRVALTPLVAGAARSVTSDGAIGNFDGATGTDNTAAFLATIASGAGRGVIPRGRYYFANDLIIDRTFEFMPIGDGGDNNAGRHTQLVFAAGKGIKVKVTTFGRPDVRIGRIGVLSLTTIATLGNYGLHITDGQDGHYELMVEGFGDHGIYVDSTAPTSLCNYNTFDRVRVIGCRGDGIRVVDNDSNVTRILNANVIGNFGWGINLEGVGKCLVVNPHADQQFNGSPGAFRDNGGVNTWITPYSEIGIGMTLGPASQWCTVLGLGGFGDPPITDTSTSKTSLILDPRQPGRIGGDTKLRNILPSLINGWTADGLVISRVGNIVELQIQKLVGTAKTLNTFLNVPVGFRPTGLDPTVMPIHDGSIPTYRNVTVRAGTLECDSASAFNYARLTWRTGDDWPLSLPGLPLP